MRMPFLALAATLTCGLAGAQTYSYEQGTYRQGATYSVSQTGDAAACAAACGEDAACLAWNYQRETGLGPAQCELKSSLGPRQPNPLMVSGVAPRIADQGSDPTPRGEDGLLGGPADTIVRTGVARSAPAALTIPPAPTRKPLSTPEVQIIVPVTAPTPPPVVAPQPEPVVAPATPSPVATVLSQPDVQISFDTPAPQAPAVSEPTAVSAATPEATQPRTPYNRLRKRIYPQYTVTRDAVIPPAEPTIIEDLDLETEDLAGDIGEPRVENIIEERRRQRRED